MKQIVKVPTRKNAILELIFTNLQSHYENPQAFPPFGLSDHNTVLSSPKAREKPRKPTKFVLRRDLFPNRKAELGRYLGSMDLRVPFTGLQSCEELLGAFQKVLSTGLDLLMPVKRVQINIGDPSWMTSEPKSLILKRQRAFHEHGSESVQFKFHRNAVNRKRKCCKAIFYETKIGQIKEGWWNEVKRLSGAQQSSSSNLISLFATDELEGLSMREVADFIIHALLEAFEEYRLADEIPRLPLEDQHLVVTEYDVYKRQPKQADGTVYLIGY